MRNKYEQHLRWVLALLVAGFLAACDDDHGAGVVGPAPLPGGGVTTLGLATTFGSIGGSGGVTNQGLNTIINGDLGTTGAPTLITGFHDSQNVYTETPLNVGAVTGSIYTGLPAPGTIESAQIAAQALVDATAAYNYLRGLPPTVPAAAADQSGATLPPGVYKFASTAAILSADLTLDGGGDPNAYWVFQVPSALTVGQAAAPRSVILTNGAQAKNVWWVCGSAATINAAGGGAMVGTIITNTGAITFSTAGNAALTLLAGRALSLTAGVTMVNTVVTVPVP